MDYRLLDKEYHLTKVIDVRSIASIYMFRFNAEYDMQFETHPSYELIYVDEGVQKVYEEEKVYEVKKGEAFLHKLNAPHKDKCGADFSSCYIISFTADCEYFSLLFDRVIKLSRTEIAALKEIFEIFINNIDYPIDKWVSDRKIVIQNTSFAISQILKNKFELFFLSILNSDLKPSLDTKSYNDPLIDNVIKELGNSKYGKFSLDSISKNVSYSKSYLCRHFKKVTGITIINYFYKIKIEEAKKMLISGKNTISEISDILNFDSVQYFSKIFKKYSGFTPSEWRTIASERMYF